MLDRRLVIVSGKGGVGKSAVATGLAIFAERHGLRVLIIEMENGGGLSAHFGTGPLRFKPTEVRPGLHAMQIVRSEALLEYLQLQLRLPGMGRFGAVARAFDALATAAPAVREIVTIGKILWEVRADRWDMVIVDAPPTGQIASYLRAPQSILELVATGRIRAQAEWMAGTLADRDQTLLLLVTLPEELPTTETLDTVAWVDRSGVVGSPIIVANRVLTELRLKPPTSGMGADIARLHQSLWEEQQIWLEKLLPDLSLPYMFGLFTPPEVAAHISDELEALR
ncbi:MAG TPA: ArsA-related P-loop ATPase [Acidimicrobiia bacterium]|nr:ArsA-related P-loop ATPase [Acidimicrobiia bacterium]